MRSVKHDLFKRALSRRSFVGLMDLYESNYQLVRRLVPALSELQGWSVSRVSGHPELFLYIDDRSRFTTTLLLTYFFEAADGERLRDPELYIRIYHDAQQVEAMSCRREGFMALQHGEGQRPPIIDCKWDSNLFLARWLEYSLELGYLFDVGAMVDEEIGSDMLLVGP